MTKRIAKLITRSRREGGSALLATLLIMVGLSLLGLAFVTVSETESVISVNERNYQQAHAVAETGARLVLEWFQDPAWAQGNGLLPANTNAIKRQRVITTAPTYTGYYKETTGKKLFDKPFKPDPDDRFYGTENAPDILIDSTTAATFLNTFNNAILKDRRNGEVTEIRIYAPPMVNATVAGGFYQTGVRYGVATIKVTGTMFSNTRQIIAQRWVKMVISEWPFPGPQGPVQSNANISTGGNFGVHWGRMTSELDMEIKRPLVGLPWYDAWDWAHFEHGYFNPGFSSTNVANAGAGFYDQYDWIHKLTGVSFEDPWYQARAKGAITNSIAGTDPHPFRFNSTAQNITNAPDVGYSNWFQGQDRDVGPPGDYQLVVFPKIDYEFWKNIAQAASTTNSNVHYLRWSAGETFTDGVTTKRFAAWVNTARATDPAKPGFYFFDTRNGLNPQGPGAPGVLTPDIDVNSSDDGNEFEIKGFVYLNAASFGTTGIRGPGGWYQFPGEPFRDVGYRKVDTATGAFDTVTPVDKAGNGKFDCQELNNNDRCDIFINPTPRAFTPPGGTATTGYFPVEWFPGCRPGFNGVTTPGGPANCSEPHEPFLNLQYPTAACCSGGGSPNGLVVGWQDPAGTITQLPILKAGDGTPVPCNTSLNPPDVNCTSNGYNPDGPLVENFGNQPNTKPIMEGVLYNEGNFDTRGNAAYYGSILINGNITGTGTPEVWFDECLVKGCWQDKFKELPRVYVTSIETDQ